MKNCVYVMYNKLSLRYGDVVCFPSDSFAVSRIVKGLQPSDLEEIELCKVGTIDVNTGIIEPMEPVRVPLDKVEKLPVNESV